VIREVGELSYEIFILPFGRLFEGRIVGVSLQCIYLQAAFAFPVGSSIAKYGTLTVEMILTGEKKNGLSAEVVFTRGMVVIVII
jgi:hypothetical protein